MKWSSIIVAGIMLSVSLSVQIPAPVLAADEASPASMELLRLQSTYDNGLKKLESDQAKAVTNLQSQYTNALALLEKKVQGAGKLEQLMVIRKEHDRFNTQKTIGDQDILSDIPELRNQQNNYIKSLKDMPFDKARGVIALVQQFDKALAALEQSLTKKGDIAGALEVRNVRDSLNSRTEVAEANFAVAEADSKKPKEPEPGQPPPVKTVKTAQPTNKVDKANAPGTKKFTGKTPNYIKQRFRELYAALHSGDKKTSRDYVDPKFLKDKGPGEVDRQLDFIFAYIWLMKSSGDVQVDASKIKVDDKEERATLVPRLRYYNRWNEQATMYWIQVDGDWYLDIYTDTRKNPNSREFHVLNWFGTRSR